MTAATNGRWLADIPQSVRRVKDRARVVYERMPNTWDRWLPLGKRGGRLPMPVTSADLVRFGAREVKR